jgi:hypothetical protein
MKDRVTGDPRGFAFVVFNEGATVDLVMAEAQHEINHKIVDVKRAQARGIAPPSIHEKREEERLKAAGGSGGGDGDGGGGGRGGGGGGDTDRPNNSHHNNSDSNNNNNTNSNENNNKMTPEQLHNKVFVGGTNKKKNRGLICVYGVLLFSLFIFIPFFPQAFLPASIATNSKPFLKNLVPLSTPLS